MPTHSHRTCSSRRLGRMPGPLWTPLMLAALGIAGAARAGDAPAASDVSELLKRIEKLEASNRALASEVETLRTGEGDAWLTEQRAAEIRSIVSDVLADSDTRSSLQSSGMTAGWNDGFFLVSPDQRFLLEVGGLLQARYIFSSVPDGQSGVTVPNSYVADNVENRSGFDMPNTQLWLEGHAFGPDWQYKIRGEFASNGEAALGQTPLSNLGNGSGDFTLIDAYIRTQLTDDFALRFGQFKLPFAREQLVDAQYQLGVARSTIVEHLGVGISQGIELSWISDDVRAAVAYSNGGDDNVYGILKGAGSDPINSAWDDDTVNWAVTSRVEFKLAGQWKQFESMTSPPGDEYAIMVGVAGSFQQGDPNFGNDNSNRDPNTWLIGTADVSLMYGGATLFGSFTYSYMDSNAAFIEGGNGFGVPDFFNIGDSSSWGAVVQGSYYFLPKWEAFARFEFGQASIDGIDDITSPSGAGSLWNDNDLMILTVGGNWYIDGEDLKWAFDAGIAFNPVDGIWWNGENGWRASEEESEFVFRTMLQMAF